MSNIVPLTFPVKILAAPLSTTGTRLILPDIKHWDGNDLTAAEVGTVIYATLQDFNKTKMELIEVDPSTLTVATTTGILINKRGCGFMGGTVAAAETQYAWSANETYVLLGSNPPQMLANLVDLDEAQTITATKTFTTAYRPKLSADGDATANEQLVTKGELARTALGTTTNESVIVAGTAGETVAAGNVVYLKVADGYWWKADASSAATAEGVELGVAQGAGTAAASITGGVLKFGRDQKNTGLTNGQKQYLSDTAGGISTSAGTVEVTLGYGLPDGTFMFTWGYDQRITEDIQDALGGTSGTPSSTNKLVTDADTEDGVDQSQTTQDGSQKVGEADATGKALSVNQTFTAGKALSNIGVKLYKAADTGTFTGNVIVYLKDVATDTTRATATITNAAWLLLPVGEFIATYAAAYIVTAGTAYKLAIAPSTADNSNHPNLGINSAGGYASGAASYYNNTDGEIALTGKDLYFKTMVAMAGKVIRANASNKVSDTMLQMTDAQAATLLAGGNNFVSNPGLTTNGNPQSATADFTVTVNCGFTPKTFRAVATLGAVAAIAWSYNGNAAVYQQTIVIDGIIGGAVAWHESYLKSTTNPSVTLEILPFAGESNTVAWGSGTAAAVGATDTGPNGYSEKFKLKSVTASGRNIVFTFTFTYSGQATYIRYGVHSLAVKGSV